VLSRPNNFLQTEKTDVLILQTYSSAWAVLLLVFSADFWCKQSAEAEVDSGGALLGDSVMEDSVMEGLGSAVKNRPFVLRVSLDRQTS
jgi:hypothetical protein